MKKLIVSIKTTSEAFSDFKKVLDKAQKGNHKQNQMEISFGKKKDFDRFAKNIGVLAAIVRHKPKSVYELAQLLKMDVSNLNKLIQFFNTVGALKLVSTVSHGRVIHTPVVEYQQIEFNLKAG